MKAIVVREYGGPEHLVLEQWKKGSPGPGEVLVRLRASGVNFIDIYQRKGAYKGELPFVPGMEGAGEVAELGEGVNNFQVGDRVAYAMVRGSYAEYAIVPADRLVHVPDTVDDVTAAAVMLQGMTAHYLVNSTVPLRPISHCLVHAAAGGVGLLIIQMAKRRGATVYGTVSNEEKARLAKEAGADEVIIYTETDFADEIHKITDGYGVDVVYDSVGQATFEKSMDSLKPRGTLVLFGQSSGAVPPVDPQILNDKGSLFLTRPSLSHYALSREELLWRSGEIFNWLENGSLQLRIDRRLPLADAADAHRLLAGRKTAGKLVLTP